MRGGEKVLEVFCERYPEADLYTLLHVPGSVSPIIENRTIVTTFLQHLPKAADKYRWYLPLMPKAIETFDLSGYDLVLSSSHCVAKGVRTGRAPHICYCHTPMRYAWDMYPHYFNRRRFGPTTLFAIERIMPYLRRWDRKTAGRVDRYIANSGYVAERIKRIYGAEATVIHPPVDTDFYTPAPGTVRDTFLIVSAFAPYKRVDLALSVFAKNGLPLTVVGGGEDDRRLRAMAAPNITFRGKVDDDELRRLFRRARGLVFPGEEDFGITPVEAMAAGAPVIAFGRGGATETVTPVRQREADAEGAPTGVFFDRQTEEGLQTGVDRFLAAEKAGLFDETVIAAQTQRFSRRRFAEQIGAFIDEALNAP
jgi:glycosyltransferase involved in cell wall biosynthesis